MILCLDVGNSQIFGGLFEDNNLKLHFRCQSGVNNSSDQYGIFLRSVLRENNIDPKFVEHVSICSVVPQVDYSLRSACIKYFDIDPFFVQAGIKTGLKINYRNPLEVGADRIANAIGAVHAFPGKNIFVVDFGTATTICAISKDKQYLGGVIMPGMKLSMNALQSNTAKLSSVAITQPKDILGRSTTESIQSGLYYSQLATIKEVTQRIQKTTFQNSDSVVIGTGGFAHLFSGESLFTLIMPDLVLYGLQLAYHHNTIEITV